MKIRHLIVHSIDKEQHQDPEDISILLRDEELPIENRVESLLDSIRKVYTDKTGKAYGELGEDRFFSRELNRFNSGDIGFIEFTKVAMNELKGHIAQQPLATGGYIIFSDFYNQGTHYFMVVMLKSKDGLSFDDELKLMDGHHLDLDRLHFAARIDISSWESDDSSNHVSFIKGRASASVTTYFKTFLGIEEFSESAKTTQALVMAVTNYFRNEKKFSIEDVEHQKQKVHDYCKSKHENEEPIYLEELSRYLDEGAPHEFLKYAQEEHNIPNEFQIDRNKLRRLLKYSGKDKDVSISFSSSAFGSRVMYDPERDVLIVNKVPKTLKRQLVQELRQGTETDSRELQ